MKALTLLPDSHAEIRREGEIAFRKFTDFNFSYSNGYAAIASKVINMKQEWMPQQEVLTTLGIWQWIVLASQQAVNILALNDDRIHHEAIREKGAMQAARDATDAALKNVVEVINSMNVMMPSDELTLLTQHLYIVEERAKQYYIPASPSDDPAPKPQPEPEPVPEPDSEPGAVG